MHRDVLVLLLSNRLGDNENASQSWRSELSVETVVDVFVVAVVELVIELLGVEWNILTRFLSNKLGDSSWQSVT